MSPAMGVDWPSIKGPGDLLITNIGQLLTLGGHARPRVGGALRDLGIVREGAVLIEGGLISAVGNKADVASEARSVEAVDARGRLVMPGFVDAHTHAAFAGSRESELSDKLAGKSYAQIAREGGGIGRTVRETRRASKDRLIRETSNRLSRMLALGTTTVEVKSGYGLNLEDEVKLLEVISTIRDRMPLDIVPTFLGAHAVPEEFEADSDGYVDYVVKTVLPKVASPPMAEFCDVFVERGFFSADQGRRVLLAGQGLGLASKVHADELTYCGGAELAAEVGATSADHILHSSEEGLGAMAAKGTLAVLLPGTSFSSKELPYCDARRVIDAGVPVALGTDLSPNSWIESMQFTLNLACYRMSLHPEEAIAAATINGAWAIGKEKEVGSLEVGKRGDALLVDLRDYREVPYRIASNSVEMVIKDGNVVVPGG